MCVIHVGLRSDRIVGRVERSIVTQPSKSLDFSNPGTHVLRCQALNIVPALLRLCIDAALGGPAGAVAKSSHSSTAHVRATGAHADSAFQRHGHHAAGRSRAAPD